MSNSTNVETNVVQMRFDNKRFEKNVSQTMNSLDKLKKELKFDDSAKSFKTLEENAKKVDFSPLSKGIEKVQASFSFLDTFSATVYHRLSNRLIDIGKKITTSVSTEGIRSGFNEYELKMNSFKTIKASAGKDFTDSQINEYLEELNRYADKTIYSFSDMTNNIGKFTNAGVKLNVAVKAIQGISNEAAISGANAQEASRAMYNFSQALSAGYVKLIDWKSIENANMATEEFKNELIKTAVSVGKLTKAQNGMYKTQKGKLLNSTRGFNDALQDQWMTTEVLTKTLEKYADETTDIGKKAFESAQMVNTFTKLIDTLKEAIQSGWSQTWELLIGNLKEATKLWTAISDKIGGVIDAFFKEKKAVLENWKAHHGRERTLAALTKIMHNLGDVLRGIGTAWRSVFPKATVNSMMRFTEGLENIAKKTVMTKSRMDPLIDTFKGIFAAIGIVIDAVTAFKQVFGKFFIKVLADALHTLFGVSGSLGQMLAQVRENLKANETFKKTFEAIVNVLEWVYDIFKKVTRVLWDFADGVWKAITSLGGLESIQHWFDGLFDAIKNFDIIGIGKSIWTLFKNIGKTIDKAMANAFDFYTPLKNKIIEAKNKIVNSKVVQWIINLFNGMADGIQAAFDRLKGVKTDGVDEVVDNTKKKFSILDSIIGFFKKAWNTIKGIAQAVWPVIKNVFKSLGTGIQMLWDGITSNIKKSDMGDAGGLLAGFGIAGLGVGFKQFIDNMKPMFQTFKMLTNGGVLKNVFNILGNASKFIKAKMLKEIAVSLLILTGAIFLLCTLPKDKVVGATAAMGVLFQGLSSVFNSIDTATATGEGAFKDGAKALTGRLFGIAAMIATVSIAMVVLTIAMRKIAKLKTEDITKGIIVIGFLFRLLSSAIITIITSGQRLRGSKAGDINIAIKGVSGIVKGLGKAILLIAAACWVLSKTMENKKGELEPKRVVIPLLAIGALIWILGQTVSRIMKYTKQFNNQVGDNSTSISILNGKGSMILTIVALGLFAKQFAKAFLILMGSIAILAVVGKLAGWKNIWLSLAAMTTAIIAVTGALVTSIWALTKMSDSLNEKGGKSGILKILAMVGVVTLFMNAISILMVVMSMLPDSWANTGVKALLAISASMSLILLALSTMLKNTFYDLTYDPKGVAVIIGSITLAIATLVASVVVMAKSLNGTSVTKAIMILVGIAGGITALIMAIGHFQKFANGFKIFSTGLAAFGIAAAGFAGAALLLITAIKSISKMSDDEIAKIGTNMKKVTTAILTASDQLIGLVMGLVHTVVGTAIGTAVTTLINSSRQIISGLIDLLDILLANAPTIVNKILQILVEVLAQLERNMGPVVVQLISTVATLVSEVAKAITDNAPKIVKAIDDVITAITTLVVGSVARMLGLGEFKTATKALIQICKPVTAALIGMFAVAKIKSSSATVALVLSKLKTKIFAFAKDVKSKGIYKSLFGTFKADYGAALDNIQRANQQGVQGMRNAHLDAAKALGGAFLTAAGIAVTVGSAVKGVIDGWTEAIDVTTSEFEDANEEFLKIKKATDDNIAAVKESNKSTLKEMESIDKKYATGDQLKRKLADVIDLSTGKVKDGREEEFEKISKELEDSLGIRVALEEGLVNIIDQQGAKRKLDLETLEKMIQEEQFYEKLKKQQEKREEKEKELQKAKELRDEAKAKQSAVTISGSGLELSEVYGFNTDLDKTTSRMSLSSFMSSKYFKDIQENDAERAKKIKDFYDNIDKYTEGRMDASASISELRNFIRNNRGMWDEEVRRNQEVVDALTKDLQSIDEGVYAYEHGLVDRMNELSLFWSGVYDPTASNEKAKNEAKRLTEKIADAIDNVDEAIYGNVEQWYEALKLYGKKSNISISEIDKMWDEFTTKYDNVWGRRSESESKSNSKTDTSIETKTGITTSWIDSDASKKAAEKAGMEIGKYQTLGTGKGAEDAVNSSSFSDTVNSVKDKTVDKYLKAFGISSPSKVMADEVGKWLGLGLIQGMEESINAYDVSTLTANLISKLQSSIFPAIAGLSGNSIPFTGITPVNFGLDQNGSGLFGAALPVDGALPYDSHLANITAILQMHSENMMNQTNIIISEIGNLRNDVVALGAHIDDMELSLDGDALVGGLTPRLNNSLYTYSRRVERGL